MGSRSLSEVVAWGYAEGGNSFGGFFVFWGIAGWKSSDRYGRIPVNHRAMEDYPSYGRKK